MARKAFTSAATCLGCDCAKSIGVRLAEIAQHLVMQTSRAALAVLFLLTGLPAAKAATFWTNTSLGDWFIDNNWDAGVPSASTTALIKNGGTAFLNSPGAVADDVFIGEFEYSSTGGNGTLLMSVGSSGVPGTLTAKSVSCGVSFGNQPQIISGTLNVSNGASVTATGLRTEEPYGVTIGDGTFSGHRGVGSVDVTGTGSLLDSKVGSIGIGIADASGTLVIENGARTQSAGGGIHIGSVTVKGAGSVWHSSKLIGLGADSPNCSMLITTGGLVEAPSLQLSNGIVTVNNGSTTAPGLTISGPGSASSFGNAGVLLIGDTTPGRMEVRNGGGVGTYRGYMGGNSGGVGAAMITDAKSRWDASGSIWVGNAGSGTLDVLAGAVVTSSGNGYLAFTNNTTGVATVDGVNSTWTMNANLYIGGNAAAAAGIGQLIIKNGGSVKAAGITLWESGLLTLGSNSTLTGPLTAMGGGIETAAAITFSNDITLGTGGLFVRNYGFNSTFSGAITGSGGLSKSGTFTGSGLGTLTLTGNCNYTGPTTIYLGKLVIDGSIVSTVTVNGGILAGSGTVGGITLNSGTLAPGDSPGILTVNGNYVQKGPGALNVEIGGPAPGSGFDQVAISGSATVDGTLNLSLVNGYRPVVGQQFAILTSSSVTGNFATIKSSGFTVRSDATPSGIVLTVTSVVPGAPVITSSTSASATQGQSFDYQITATESPTGFDATPLPPGLSVDTATGVISGTPTTIGTFDVVVSATNSTSTGSATLTITVSAVPPLTPTPTPTPTAGSLGNISTRLRVETGDNVLIGGFIVTGNEPKRVIIRAIGPSLPVADALGDPVLEVYDGSGNLIATNDNWVDSADKQAIIDTTIPPSNDLESAVVGSAPPGAYTAIVRGVNGGTGVGLIEVYDLDLPADSRLANISTRGLVQTGDNVMIGGLFVVGSTSQKVIVRAIGPSLPVDSKLLDPTLELRDGNGGLVDTNDNWRSNHEAEIIATTVPPTDDAESAVVQTLAPGPYTAIVRGVNDTTGVALVEVYALQ